MKISLSEEDLQTITKLREELKKAKNVVYRGVYKNTILDWQPDEEHEYPRGTNVYIKDGNEWKPYTGIFFKEECILTDFGKVTPWEYEIHLKSQSAERLTVYEEYYKGELKDSIQFIDAVSI